jgi:hypothetical protein
MTSHAAGTFVPEVTAVTEDRDGSVASGRMALKKTFQGDLAAISVGEMWTVGTSVQGSAGYVAIERVTGSLHGRSGSFVLLHQGTMRRGGDFKLTIVVVPDSGSEQLAGLTGTMTIVIAGDGGHAYELAYALEGGTS